MTDAWRFWTSSEIARITECPETAVRDHWPLIAQALDRRGIYDRDVCLGVLGTVAIETAGTFEPVQEAFWFSDSYRTGLEYAPFWGRGYIQLTHESNYAAASEEFALDFLGHPDEALSPPNAAAILAWFWATRGVDAKDGSRWWSLPDLCRAHDWTWTRRVVQGGTAGLDRLIAIATALDAVKEEPVPDAPIYDPDTPAILQNDDWSCAATAARWAMVAYGRRPSEAWFESTLLADAIESVAQGLLDASGGRLAAWITEQYGEFGYVARNNGSVSFDDVRSVAGASPVLIGGRRWNHWTGVRRYDPVRDVLVLANPGGTGPTYGQQTLSRQQFAELGEFSAVVISHESAAAPPPAPPPSPPPVDPLAAWIEALAYIGDDIGDDLDALPARLRAAADTIERSVDELRRVRGDLVGPRPA